MHGYLFKHLGIDSSTDRLIGIGLSKATSSLFPHQDDCNTRIDIRNVQQNIEQLQTPTNGSINEQKVNNNRTTALEQTAA